MSEDNSHVQPDPQSINRIFSEDPLNLSRIDHVLLIRELRLQRQRFEAVEDKTKRAPKTISTQRKLTTTVAKPKKQKLDPGLTLADLLGAEPLDLDGLK